MVGAAGLDPPAEPRLERCRPAKDDVAMALTRSPTHNIVTDPAASIARYPRRLASVTLTGHGAPDSNPAPKPSELSGARLLA